MPFYLHLLEALLQCKIKLFYIKVAGLGVPIFRVFTVYEIFLITSKFDAALVKHYTKDNVKYGLFKHSRASTFKHNIAKFRKYLRIYACPGYQQVSVSNIIILLVSEKKGLLKYMYSTQVTFGQGH